MTTDREFVHSRVIDAPPEEVFGAFSDPTRLANWWGPDGFVSTFETCEFRSGGAWRFVMHGPDGQQYPMNAVFREVVPNERVVFENLAEGHHFVLTITLVPQDRNSTLVGWRQVFDTAAHRDLIAPVVIPASEQNLARLAAAVLPRGKPAG